MEITALVLFLLFTTWFLITRKKKITFPEESLPGKYQTILKENVTFYIKLNDADKLLFEKRAQQFLSRVKITGVNTVVEPIDSVFIAASAIIPIFAFKNWEYNLHEVLLYPDSFNEEFNMQNEQERPVLGMVGSGAMQHVMILSQPSLREGFINKTDKSNTGIHEFVHLIDKTDGEVDGIPDYLLDKQHLLPWINLIHKNIKEILAGKSDINPYGATNKAEFFAVVSEYFFERPDLLKTKHPELYRLLVEVFTHKSS